MNYRFSFYSKKNIIKSTGTQSLLEHLYINFIN